MIDEIIEFYKQDLQLSKLTEFPVSPMSASLSHAIHTVLEDRGIMSVPNLCGLDVGSGSGIQAAILAHCGCEKIQAIDICRSAVKAAEERFRRLHISLNNSCIAKYQFKECSLENIPTENYKYDIIVTNPPSYFTDRSAHETPLDFGLYDGSAKHANDPSKSFLYKYFERIVKPCLKPGGVSICTWPGIEYRLAHDTDESSKQIAHPTALLQKWFGWHFDTTANLKGEDFYSYEASITGSSMDDFFLDEFNAHLGVRGCYSSDLLTAPRTKSEFTPTFKFGILVILRDKVDSNLFRFKEVSPSGGNYD